MRELVFADKNFGVVFNRTDSNSDFSLPKPMLCPHCNAFQDSTIVSKTLYPGWDNVQIGNVCCRCTYCNKHYIVTYEINLKEHNAKFSAFYPPESINYENEKLVNVSPRFIDTYNQALRCELRGDIELAAIGFRQALECLVKDYAIVELKEQPENVIKKSLCNAISDFLGERDLVATADVIRILGNDYAHYERKYPEHDFMCLKQYMEIFTKMIEAKILIAHPPVARK